LGSVQVEDMELVVDPTKQARSVTAGTINEKTWGTLSFTRMVLSADVPTIYSKMAMAIP
jgi:hypothetical protein